MAAHLRGPHGAGTTIHVYDTAQGSQQAYLKAQLDGADFIVGPLLKPEVDQVITQAGFVPTLALNFATKEGTFLRSFYQFALAPEDEARTIAATAAASGAKTALAFVPSNARGYQIRDTFRAEFEARGGQLLDCERLRPFAAGFLEADRIAAERHAQRAALPSARGESRRDGAVRAAAPPGCRHDLHRGRLTHRPAAGSAVTVLLRRRHSDVRDGRYLRSGQHAANQRPERPHLRRYAGVARARRHRDERSPASGPRSGRNGWVSCGYTAWASTPTT